MPQPFPSRARTERLPLRSLPGAHALFCFIVLGRVEEATLNDVEVSSEDHRTKTGPFDCV